MSKRTDQKRVARHKRSIEAKHDRLIAAYVKKRYPAINKKANNYYEALQTKYPNKRDLTKTPEFLSLDCKVGKNVGKTRSKTQITTTTTVINDSMTLQIPLMDKSDVDTATNLSIPEDINDSLIADLRKDPQLNTVFNDIIAEDKEQQHDQNLQEQVDESLQDLDESLQELSNAFPQLFEETTPLEKELSQLTYQ